MKKAPSIITPISVTLSKLSLRLILASYMVLQFALSVVLGFMLKMADNASSLQHHIFQAFGSLWAASDLMSVDGKSTQYYAVAAVATSLGVVLPIFLLGAFVFKLFRHDPLKWRDHIALIDYRDQGPTLVVRLYNRTHDTLADVQIRVTARILSDGDPKLRVNRPLKACGDVTETIFPVMETGSPFTIRIPLGRPRMTAQQVCTSPHVPVPASPDEKGTEPIQLRQLVTYAVVAKGIQASTGQPFLSIKEYSAEDLQLGNPQEIYIDQAKAPHEWAGWDRFEEVQPMYVFGYGSLVSSESTAETLGYSIPKGSGPTLAILGGYVRAWNVASPTASRPDRIYETADGKSWSGIIVSLGLEENDVGEVPGAVYQVTNTDLWVLDMRERNYDRVDVSRSTSWSGKPGNALVFTYVPRRAAIEIASRARGEGVITARYLEITRDGYAALGDEALNLHESTKPSTADHSILDIRFRQSSENEARRSIEPPS